MKTRRFVDANVFIYHLDAHPRFGGAARAILERIHSGEPAVASTLVVSEVCAYLWRLGRRVEIGAFLDALPRLRGLRVEPITLLDMVEGHRLSVTHPSLELNDGISLAVMRRMGLREIYTNDTGFDPVARRVFA
ncbi:MAG: type II toxin-antitoxin system VapC family toxin [Euryarchaeota archaeon]|nr:type II toxin-antitoxin system VapC family toxin [Euryarchaeota archaeon]